MVRQVSIMVVVLVIFIGVLGAASARSASVPAKTFHILYSADERGSITPCG